MKKRIILPIITFITSISYAQTKNFIDQPFVETIAKVDTLVSPNRIFLSIRISESDTKGKQTVEKLEKTMANKLELIGINLKKQLTVSDLSSNFKKYFLRKKDILKTKSYELSVHSAQTAGRVIYELEGIGISNVNLQRTEYSKPDELQLILRSKAVEKAKKQAEAMVKPLNQQIGKAIFISDTMSPQLFTNRLYGKAANLRVGYARNSDKSYSTLPVEFDKIKFESRVNVRFTIN